MKSTSAFFTEADKKMIAEAVASAESMTSCEIVPAVATASGRYDRAEDIFGLILSLVLLSVYWFFFQAPPEADWGAGAAALPPLWPVLVIVIAGFIAGASLATMFPVLRLPFLAKQEMKEEVERCAMETFKRQRIRATENSNGVLIYVSLYEHMVHVAGDDAVNEVVTAEDLQQVADIVVEGMKHGNPGSGIADAIKCCGEILKASFPYEEGDINELNDGLVILD
jgi:putative membrane protein